MNMISGALLIAIGILFLVGIFVLRPLFRPTVGERPLTPREQLLQQKELLLDQVQSLEFDHTTGKVTTEMFEYERSNLMKQATDVLRKLDQLGEDEGNEIEQFIASFRKQS